MTVLRSPHLQSEVGKEESADYPPDVPSSISHEPLGAGPTAGTQLALPGEMGPSPSTQKRGTGKLREDPLRRRVEELTILHAVATAGAEATDEDALIERATQIIGENIFPDNLGLLLLDERAGCLRPHSSYREGGQARPYQQIGLGEGICGWVAATGKALRVGDTRQESKYIQIDPRTRSEVCVPLKAGDRVFGVINAESAELDAFTETDERLLSTLAGQLATAVDRLRADAAMRRRAKQLDVLSRVSQGVVASLIPDQVYSAIHQAAAQLMTTETFIITLHDEVAQLITPVYFVELGKPVNAEPIPAGRGLSGHVIATGKPFLANDQDDLEGIDIVHAGDTETSRSVLAVPMRLGDRILGVLSCQCYRPCAYSFDDLQTLKTLASQAAIAIENARLFAETQRRLGELTFLSQIIAITATENDLSVALNQICSELAHFLQVPEVSFALLNSQITSAQVIAEFHEPGRPASLGAQIPVIGNPPLGYILQHAIYLDLPDAKQHPLMAALQPMVEARQLASMLLLPIILGGEVVGTLEVASTRRREFSLAEIALVEKVAKQVGQVLERLGLFAATREQAERMAHLATLSEGLNRARTSLEVIQTIGEGARQLSNADRAALYLRAENDVVSAPWSKGLSPEYLTHVVARFAELPGGTLLHNPSPVLTPDLQLLPEDSLLRQLGTQEGFHALALWPVVYQEHVIAALGCYYDTVHLVSDAEQEVMLAFARQAAAALQNARLFDETRRRATHLEALNAIIAEVAAAPDLNHLLEKALDLTLGALELQAGAIWLGGHQIVRDMPPDISGACGMAQRSDSSKAAASIAISDWRQVEAGAAHFSYQAVMAQYGVMASLVVPLLSEGRHMGGLCVASRQARPWLADEVALVEGVGRQLGGAIERLSLLEKIQENARRVQHIIDSVPEGVILLDNEHRIVLANPAAQAYLLDLLGARIGDSLEHLAGKPVTELLNPQPQEIWSEAEILAPVHHIFELAARPLERADQAGGWVVVMRNVTQERENQARIQMQDRLATVGQLAAGIAHDFNNIMAAIVVYADLLKRDSNLTAVSRDRLDVITQQVQRASSLIRQILDFSRRSVMEQSTLDLLPFIKELEKLLRRVLPENIRLELTYRPGAYPVKADPTRLQQVFMNLAVNARDASPQGGVLQFELERLHLAEDAIPPCPDLPAGRWIRVTVRDSGEGIPPDVLPHVFEPFYTTKSVGTGTGLGLAQAYGIIQQHEGYIDVHSSPVGGATFHIYLREQEQPEEPAAPPSSPEEISGQGETILLVEDDFSARQAMLTLLENDNYRVLEASNGAEALYIYDQHGEGIDLVVSDLVMPEMGGIALYQALLGRWPGLRILFVTGHPLNEAEHTLLKNGRVHWLQKPFSVQVLNQALRSALSEPA